MVSFLCRLQHHGSTDSTPNFSRNTDMEKLALGVQNRQYVYGASGGARILEVVGPTTAGSKVVW